MSQNNIVSERKNISTRKVYQSIRVGIHELFFSFRVFYVNLFFTFISLVISLFSILLGQVHYESPCKVYIPGQNPPIEIENAPKMQVFR